MLFVRENGTLLRNCFCYVDKTLLMNFLHIYFILFYFSCLCLCLCFCAFLSHGNKLFILFFFYYYFSLYWFHSCLSHSLTLFHVIKLCYAKKKKQILTLSLLLSHQCDLISCLVGKCRTIRLGAVILLGIGHHHPQHL